LRETGTKGEDEEGKEWSMEASMLGITAPLGWSTKVYKRQM